MAHEKDIILWYIARCNLILKSFIRVYFVVKKVYSGGPRQNAKMCGIELNNYSLKGDFLMKKNYEKFISRKCMKSFFAKLVSGTLLVDVNNIQFFAYFPWERAYLSLLIKFYSSWITFW